MKKNKRFGVNFIAGLLALGLLAVLIPGLTTFTLPGMILAAIGLGVVGVIWWAIKYVIDHQEPRDH